jgi:hypothetical protein
MLANAVFWQSAHRGREWQPQRDVSPEMMGVSVGEPLRSGLSLVASRMDAVYTAAEALRRQRLDPLPSWLDDAQAMSTFGLSGEAIWRRTLDGFEKVGSRLAESVARAQALAGTAPESLREALLDLERAIHYTAPEAWDQDFGYQGLLRTLDVAHDLLRQAGANFDVELAPSQDPYEHDDVSPYHLVAACYYSALGVYLNAWYLMRVHEVRLEDLTLLLDASTREEWRDSPVREVRRAP